MSSIALEDAGRGAQARQALVRAAVEVFGESGLEAATTRDIAQRARQNIAAIAYYFGGKDGLYAAVVEHIVAVVLERFGPLMDEIEGFLRSGESAARALAPLPSATAGLSIATNSMMPVTGIIVREQTHPTRAFSILYDGCLERLQRLGAALVGAYLGMPADETECVVRFHALLGAGARVPLRARDGRAARRVERHHRTRRGRHPLGRHRARGARPARAATNEVNLLRRRRT